MTSSHLVPTSSSSEGTYYSTTSSPTPSHYVEGTRWGTPQTRRRTDDLVPQKRTQSNTTTRSGGAT